MLPQKLSYYRHWHQVAPRREETELRDVLQRVAVGHRHYGYRRLNALLRREGWAVNHKRVLRLMRTDNLLCLRRRSFVPATTDSRHDWRVVPNLARGMQVTGLDQLWVADITYLRLLEEFAFLAVVLDAFSRRVIGWAEPSAGRPGGGRARDGVAEFLVDGGTWHVAQRALRSKRALPRSKASAARWERSSRRSTIASGCTRR